MAGNTGNSGPSNDTGLILFVIVLVAGPFLAWFILQKPVVFLWSWISYGQTWLLAHAEAVWQHQSAAAEIAANRPLLHWFLWAHAHPGKIPWKDVAQYSAILGTYYRWPVIALVAVLAWRNYRAVDLRKTRQGLNDFVIAMKGRYPWGLPWLWQKNGTLTKTDSGSLRLALRPWEWVRSLESPGKPLVYKEQDDSPETTVLADPERLRAAFAAQLAHPMDEYAHWPLWFQALTTAFVPQARDGKDRETFDRLSTLARHYYGTIPKPGREYVPPTLKTIPWTVTDADREYLRGIAKRHGFRETFFLGLLAEARVRGLLPPAYFAWLRAVDRGLWYAAQSLGRPRSFIEGSGIIAHYQAERGRAGAVPSVDESDDIVALYGDHAESLNVPQTESALAGLVFALREEDAGISEDKALGESFPAGWRA
jgi:hypothetical protein